MLRKPALRIYLALAFIEKKTQKRKSEQMKKDNLPLIIIIVSFLLIILNFIFTSDEMNLGFWLRIILSILLILAMYFTIRERKKTK